MSEEFIDNWEIRETSANGTGGVLVHKYCPKSGKYAYTAVPVRKILGSWVCSECNMTAPEEIAFVADLSFVSVDALVDTPVSVTPIPYPTITIAGKYTDLSKATLPTITGTVTGRTSIYGLSKTTYPILGKHFGTVQFTNPPVPIQFTNPVSVVSSEYDIIEPGDGNPDNNPGGFILAADGRPLLNES